MSIELLEQLRDRFNARDYDRVPELFTEDVELDPAPEWPNTAPQPGRAGVTRFMHDFLEPWESLEMRMDETVENADRIGVRGAWESKGGASGVVGEIPFGLVCTMRGDLIARLEWFMDPADGLAAVR